MRNIILLMLLTLLNTSLTAQHYLSLNTGYGNTLHFPENKPAHTVTFPNTFSWGGSYFYARQGQQMGWELGVAYGSFMLKQRFAYASTGQYGYASLSSISNLVVPLDRMMPGLSVALGPGLSYSPAIEDYSLFTIDTVATGMPRSPAAAELKMSLNNKGELFSFLGRASMIHQRQLRHGHFLRFQLGGQYFFTPMARGSYELYARQQTTSGKVVIRPKQFTLSIAYGI